MKNSQKGSASLTAIILASFLLSLGGTGSAITLFRQNPDQFFADLRTYAQKLSNITFTELPSLTATIDITPATTPADAETTPAVTPETTPTPTPVVTSAHAPTPTPDASDDEKEEREGDKEHKSRKRGLGIFIRGEQKLRQFLKFQFKVEAHDR